MTSTLPHARWETLQTEAEDFADNIKSIVEATLVRMDADERRIYCQHLYEMSQIWGFEPQAQDHDMHIEHGKNCPCDECVSVWGIDF